MTHAKEPWAMMEINGEKGWLSVVSNDGKVIYRCEGEGIDNREAWRANAERVILCVNACSSLSSDLLKHLNSASLKNGLSETA